MRNPRLIILLLVLSLAGNVGLAAAWWSQRAPASHDRLRTNTNDPGSSSSTKANPSDVVRNSSGSAPRTWAQLARGTPADLRRRLEAAGYPRWLIFEIVMREILRLDRHSPQRSADSLAATPYWRNSTSAPMSREESLRWRERHTQRLEEAFGPEGYRYSDTGREYFSRRFGPLSDEKLNQLIELDNDMDHVRRELLKETSDPEEASKRMTLLEAQRRDEMAKILTPEELLEHDFRSGPARHFITEQLNHLNLSEAEYRTLFPIAQNALERYRDRFSDPVAARAAQQAMLAELQPNVRELLGEARFADYLQAIDPDSDRLNRVAARFDLPLSVAAEAAAARRDAVARSEALRADPSLTWEQRAAHLRELHAEATQRLTQALGPDATRAYLSYDGRWLQQLAPSE